MARGDRAPGESLQGRTIGGGAMKTMKRDGSVSLGALAGCFMLAACSGERAVDIPTRVESVEQALEAVPDDGSDFQAQMGIDENGHIIPGPVTKGEGAL